MGTEITDLITGGNRVKNIQLNVIEMKTNSELNLPLSLIHSIILLSDQIPKMPTRMKLMI